MLCNAKLSGIPGTCVVSGGTCTITNNNVNVTGTLAANQTITIDYKVRVANGPGPGTNLSITSTVTNASFSLKASEYDPEVTGWLLAVAINAQGNRSRTMR
jgi:phage-related protein